MRPLVPEDYPVVKEIVAEAFGADLPPDTQNLWSRPVEFRVCAYIGVMERAAAAWFPTPGIANRSCRMRR